MKYLKLLALTILGVLCCNDSYAYDFEVDGMYYNILSSNSVEITYRRYEGGSYSGELVIPTYVAYNGQVYSVVSIGSYAFSYCNITGALTIPNSVTSIGHFAFQGCRGLTGSLTIPSTVTSIGNFAFERCSGFTGSLAIPSSVTSIGNYAFYECSGLTGSLTIPGSVTFIGNCAFSGCSGFTGSLTIPSSVTSIGYNAFYGCRGFTGSLIIPSSVISIGESAFYNCSGFELVISEILSPFDIADNVFYNLNAILQVPKGTKKSYQALYGWNNSFKEIREAYVLSITALGNGSVSFNGTEVRGTTSSFTVNEGTSETISVTPDEGWHIASVKMNNTDVTSSVANNQYTISNITSDLSVDVVFESNEFVVDGICYNILSSNSVEITYRGNGASYSGELIIPNSVEYNGKVYDVVSIGRYAFYNCVSLTGSLTIPNSVTSVGECAFGHCAGLKGLLIIPNSVTSIGNSAFYDCRGFTGSLTIPNSVTSIGNSAFAGCSGFKGVLTIPNSVTSIGDNAFNGCIGFTGSLTIPNSVTSIGDNAFNGCIGFTGSLTIPNSVTSIGDNAFNGCIGFTGSLTIPNSVTSIGDNAFDGCRGLTGSLTIPNSVTSIGNNAFYKCTSFTGSLTIPNSVAFIGGYAFYGCSGFELVISEILSPFNISTGVFYGLNAVLQVPKGTKSKYQALSGWNNNFKEIREEEGSTHVLSITASGNGSASFNGTVVRGATSTFNVIEGTSATVSFTPDEGCHIASVKVNNADVTSSVVNNQYTINNITSDLSVDVVFGKKSFVVNGIRYNILDYIHKEVEVTYNLVNEHNEWVGYDGDIVVPRTVAYNGITYKVIKIGNCAFREEEQDWNFAPWSTLTSVTISEGIESIGDWAFSDCVVLKKIVMPSSITSIGRSAFNECRSLQSIEIPNGVTTIEEHTFYFCKSLTSIKLPSNLSTIKTSSFGICSSLEEIKLPETLKSIEKRSFHDCGLLSKVVSYIKSPFAIDKESFQKICSSPVLYVPKGTKADYSSASGWKDIFNEIVEIETTNSCQLNIIASGNGSVSFNGTSVRDETRTFTVSEGTSATVSFTPDEGCRIASVKVNDTDVTSSVVNNQYTINNVTSDLSVNVVFESNRFEVNSIYYNILSSNSVEITYCKRNYSGELIIPNSVEYNGKVYDVVSIGEEAFEDCSGLTGSLTIPSSVTKIGDYAFHGCSGLSGSLTIPNSVTSIGEGAFYNCRGLTGSLTIPSSVTSIRFIAFCGCSGFTGSLTIPNSVTSIGESAFSRCSGLTGSLIIPSSVKSIGEEAFAECRFTGSLTIPNSVVSIGKSAFYQCNGFTGSLTIPNSVTSIGHRAFIGCSGFELVISEILSPSNISNETLLLYNPNAVLQVPKGTKSKYQALNGWICNFKEIREEGEEENITALDAEGVNYMVVSQAERTIQVAAGDYGQVLTVPATVSAQGLTWQVTGIEKDALKDNASLAAVIWEPEVAFTATVSNPNLLLYVKDEQYAQSDVKNVVVNGTANSVVLVEAAAGNSFYCPQAFTAHQISYTHNYQMQTGIGEAKGWETLALPFDVQSITHQEKGNIVPFASRNGSDERPFWLYELTGSGFVEAGSIKAYTPYIISMPNHPQYYDQWLLRGNVTFTASDVIVGVTSDVRTVTYGNRTFVPCFTEKGSNEGLYAMNVNNDYVDNSSGMAEGSKFVLNMRNIHPFEAYMTTTSANPQYSFGIFDGMATKVSALEVGDLLKDETYYDLQGRKTIAPTKRGVYITNGRKKVIK